MKAGSQSGMAGIVLAAGESRRMGGGKQLLPVEGGTLLGRVLEACLTSGLDEVVLVLGHRADRVRASLGDLLTHPKLRIVVNPGYRDGMSTSLATGLRAVEERFDRIMVILGDMPHVSTETVDRLRRAVSASGRPLGAVTFHGRRSHPVVIGREHYGAIRNQEGDRGARDLFRDHPEAVCLVEAEAAYEPSDIDTRADYERFLSEERRKAGARRGRGEEEGSP